MTMLVLVFLHCKRVKISCSSTEVVSSVWQFGYEPYPSKASTVVVRNIYPNCFTPLFTNCKLIESANCHNFVSFPERKILFYFFRWRFVGSDQEETKCIPFQLQKLFLKLEVRYSLCIVCRKYESL